MLLSEEFCILIQILMNFVPNCSSDISTDRGLTPKVEMELLDEPMVT